MDMLAQPTPPDDWLTADAQTVAPALLGWELVEQRN